MEFQQDGQQDAQRLGLGIINLYEGRMRMIISLIREAVMAAADCSKEQEEMISHIRDNLANVGYLRRKDFDSHMAGVLARMGKMRKNAKDAAEGFLTEEGKIADEMVNILRKTLACGGISFSAIEILPIVKTEILPRHHEMEKRLAGVLMEFQMEQTALNTALKALLSKGERVRIKDLKAMVYAINIYYGENGKGINRALKGFEKTRQETTAEWHGLFSAYGKNIGDYADCLIPITQI